MKLRLKLFVLIILSFWLAFTVLVDFIAVPNIFRNISNLFEAGNLGMIIFNALNTIEVIFSILLIIIFFIIRPSRHFKKILISLLFLFNIGLTYYTFLTPKISSLTLRMRDVVEESAEYLILQKEHDFFHQLYIKLDSLKLILLIFLIIIVFRSISKGIKV